MNRVILSVVEVDNGYIVNHYLKNQEGKPIEVVRLFQNTSTRIATAHKLRDFLSGYFTKKVKNEQKK